MSDTIFCQRCGQLKSECICGRINGGDKMENIKLVEEEPVFELRGDSTINHIPDGRKKVYWNDLKESETGDEWIASGNSSCTTATILFKDEQGCLIRFVHEDTNEYTNYPDTVRLEYYDFGRS